MSSEILVGDYLWARIKQLGVKSIFGVPGGTFPLLLYEPLLAPVMPLVLTG